MLCYIFTSEFSRTYIKARNMIAEINTKTLSIYFGVPTFIVGILMACPNSMPKKFSVISKVRVCVHKGVISIKSENP